MESDTDMEMYNTWDEEDYYDDYGGDFSINGKPNGGGNGKKREKKKEKTKGNGESIYNTKHVRLALVKTENSKSKRSK